MQLACARHCRGDTAGSRKMVLLDQERVVETNAVVVTAATGHGVLLRETQSGDRLACVENPGLGALDSRDVSGGDGCRRREGLQEIQGGSFAGQ